MRKIDIELRRFSIKIGDLDFVEADAYHVLMDDVTKEMVGIAWITCYEDHNEVCTARDIPYMVIDREYPYSLQDFLSMKTTMQTEKPPDGYL